MIGKSRKVDRGATRRIRTLADRSFARYTQARACFVKASSLYRGSFDARASFAVFSIQIRHYRNSCRLGRYLLVKSSMAGKEREKNDGEKQRRNRREGRDERLNQGENRRRTKEAAGEKDRRRTSVTSEEPGAISGGFCAPFKNASYGGCRERERKGGSEEKSAESFANVRTSGPSGPTNPWAKWGEEGGSREVNCRSFRVLPLHSRALYFPFPSMRSDPSLSPYTVPSSRGRCISWRNHSDNEGNFNDLPVQ